MDVRMVETPLTPKDLYPTIRYEFSQGAVSQESDHMWNELQEFIETNFDLVSQRYMGEREDFLRGFQTAMAVTRLWVDSIYLQQEPTLGSKMLAQAKSNKSK